MFTCKKKQLIYLLFFSAKKCIKYRLNQFFFLKRNARENPREKKKKIKKA